MHKVGRFDRVRLLVPLALALPLPAYAATSGVTMPDAAVQGNVLSVERGGMALSRVAGDVGASDASSVALAESRGQNAIQGLRQGSQDNLLAPRIDVRTSASQKVSATAPASVTAPAPAAPETPDERPLWKLLRDKQLVQLDAAIQMMHRKFAQWSPPAALLEERNRQREALDIQQALAGDLTLLRTLLANDPAAFGCDHIDRAWHAADSLADAHDDAGVYAIYSRLIPDCSSDVNRLVTLQRSTQQLAPSQVDALVQRERQYGVRSAETERRFSRWWIAREMTSIKQASLSDATLQARLLTLEEPVRQAGDSDAATQAGWLLLARKQQDAAARWFGLAIALRHDGDAAADTKMSDASANDALLGLAQVRLLQGDMDAAQQLLDQCADAQKLAGASDPRVQALRVQLDLARADTAYRAKDFARSLQYLAQARLAGATPEQTDMMQGWSLYNLGQVSEAQAIFASRYTRLHDEDSAEGLALSRRAMQKQHLASMGTPERSMQPQAVPGTPLARYTDALAAQQLYYEKSFLAAQAVWSGVDAGGNDAQRVARYLPADLQGIDAASVTSGLSASDHAGVNGTSRLKAFSPTLEAAWFAPNRAYDLQYRQHILSTGTQTVNAEQLLFSVSDTLQIRDDRVTQLFGTAGVTQGGAVGATLQGEAGLAQRSATNGWRAYLGSAPVQDSLLSWRGETVPAAPAVTGNAAGTTWGGVTRQYAGSAAQWQFAPRWTASTSGELQWLRGRNVLGNTGAKADASISYDLGISGFDYVSVGPAFHYLGYRRNENFYAAQQGGYYSPQHSVSTGVMLQWLSKEGAQRQWKGNLEAGWNYSSQSDGDCTDGATVCRGSTNRGVYTHAQFAGVQRLSAQWQAGAMIDVNVTPGRDKQIAALAFLRYFLTPRAAVFSDDLPQDILHLHAAPASSH